ncbi:MAG: sensor histidine kinase [Gemmatimonadota bacterium]
MRLITGKRAGSPPIVVPPPVTVLPPVTVAPAATAVPGADELDDRVSSSLRRRQLALRVLVLGFVVLPAVLLFAHHGLTGRGLFLIPATPVFAVLIDRVVLIRCPGDDVQSRWVPFLLILTVALAAGLFAVGQMNWLTPLAVAAAAVGRLTAGGRATLLRLGSCSALAAGIGVFQHLQLANIIIAAGVCALGGLLAHSAERRFVLISRLNSARAELARMAVAEERLRIARDLHDLLGHSLSLIALKAELAGRLLEPDPQRAAREISELETVARRSLTEVRQAVTGYRQPGLAAELATGRQMLAAAGVDCRLAVPAACSFPPDIDALLAWTVREGTTNIVRHARARHASILIGVTGDQVCAELADDGTGPARDPGAGAAPPPARPATAESGPPAAGCGLAGLTERAARLGGTLLAGAGEHGGFRLRVSVPLAAAGVGPEQGGPAVTPLEASA